MDAQKHARQAARLRALRSYAILDTAPEQEFDDIVQLASKICGTPISVVNLVHHDRQWFKSEVGLGVRQTPIETSICAHAILEDAFVEISDTLNDPRMAGNPLVHGDPSLRFYAGAQLKTSDGLPIGTLCVLDYEPRELTELQRETLRVLANQVMVQLEMKKALNEATILRQEVDHRVKNSLQSILSYTRILSRSMTSDEGKDVLASLQRRIQAMSVLHEQIYRTQSGGAVELGEYLQNLCVHLDALAPDGVRLSVTTDTTTINAQQAAATGTLVNEFVANAFKHAFPDERKGSVSITMQVLRDNKVKITCADDGVGLAPDASQSDGLGMKVAALICMQLQTDLVYEQRETGHAVSFTFEPYGDEARAIR
ncbi:MAG: histidine kinase dimerization/phosphoacceptor domain -containing protein [Deltaproteobacteria bacterium]